MSSASASPTADMPQAGEAHTHAPRAAVAHDLYSIPYSHYNEKARWMLDACGIPYTRHDFLPLLHMIGVARVQSRFGVNGRKDAISSQYSTPTLAISDVRDGHLIPRTLLTDSSAIGRYAAAQRDPRFHNLYSPGDVTAPPCEPTKLVVDADIAELEKRFHDNVGPSARLFAYYFLLPGRRGLLRSILMNIRLLFNNLPLWQFMIGLLAFPLLYLALNFSFGLTEARMQRAKTRLLAECDFVEAKLADGRRYLCGDKLSSADITFAALMAPVLGITQKEGYGAWMPSLEDAPAPLAEFAQSIRARPAGQFALRLFAQDRRAPAPKPRL